MNQPVPAKHVPQSVPSLKTEGEIKVFNKDQLSFLSAYAGCMDEDQAGTEAGIDKKHLAELMREPHVAAEMLNIQKVWYYQVRMKGGYAAGKHQQLMEKFEQEYDKQGAADNKARFAGVLAKMSEASLKSTGLIGSQSADAMPTVILNLNTDGGGATVQVAQVPADNKGAVK